MTFTYGSDPGRTDADTVRLLLNDVDADHPVFTDTEIDRFIAVEGGQVKLAAAQAIDTNADNELLASKVLTSQDWQADGAKVADSMRKRAAALRLQHAEATDASDGGFFDIVDGPSLGCFI